MAQASVTVSQAIPRPASRRAASDGRRGKIKVDAVFCPADVADPFDTVEWDTAHRRHQGRSGRGALRADQLRNSRRWSQLATNVVVSKYFYGEIDTPEREHERPPVDPSRQPHDRRLGPCKTATSPRPKTASTSIAT